MGRAKTGQHQLRSTWSGAVTRNEFSHGQVKSPEVAPLLLNFTPSAPFWCIYSPRQEMGCRLGRNSPFLAAGRSHPAVLPTANFVW